MIKFNCIARNADGYAVATITLTATNSTEALDRALWYSEGTDWIGQVADWLVIRV